MRTVIVPAVRGDGGFIKKSGREWGAVALAADRMRDPRKKWRTSTSNYAIDERETTADGASARGLLPRPSPYRAA
eukprot:2005638-Pleurochrysis_carterae.AAC.1